jgi:hypothetical protein
MTNPPVLVYKVRVSEKTVRALAKLDELLPALKGLPGASAPDSEIIEAAEALKRAVAAFHMEAIRFRMHTVDRLLKAAGDDIRCRRLFDELRVELENAGFHTRSHSAPS